MTQIGTIEKILPAHKAVVSVARTTACAHDCTECAGCGTTASPISCVAENCVCAKFGDKVILESDNKSFFKIAIIVYVLPFFLFFVGYFLTSVLSENLRILISSIIFILSFIFVGVYDRKVKNKNLVVYRIKRIL